MGKIIVGVLKYGNMALFAGLLLWALVSPPALH